MHVYGSRNMYRGACLQGRNGGADVENRLWPQSRKQRVRGTGRAGLYIYIYICSNSFQLTNLLPQQCLLSKGRNDFSDSEKSARTENS